MRRRRRSSQDFLAVGLATLAQVVARRLRRRATRSANTDGSLDDVNDHFHEAYDRARRAAEHDEPVLVVLEDSLVVFRGKTRTDVTFTPPAFHVLKAVAHAPVALFTLLGSAGALDEATRVRLRLVRRALVSSQESVAKAGLDVTTAETLFKVISASLSFVAQLDEAGRRDDDAVRRFAREMGPELLRMTEDATRLQLVALDAQVATEVRRMTERERNTFQVVVAGDHQARARSLGMQYFEKLFGEPPGAERRVTYGEGITDAQQAVKLVGTRRLDRAIADSFFADPKRLQRDVLGDAVASLLQTFDSKLHPGEIALLAGGAVDARKRL